MQIAFVCVHAAKVSQEGNSGVKATFPKVKGVCVCVCVHTGLVHVSGETAVIGSNVVVTATKTHLKTSPCSPSFILYHFILSSHVLYVDFVGVYVRPYMQVCTEPFQSDTQVRTRRWCLVLSP